MSTALTRAYLAKKAPVKMGEIAYPKPHIEETKMQIGDAKITHAPSLTPKTYEEMFRAITPVPRPVDDEAYRRKQLIANIADGLGAIGNLIATTQGAYSAKQRPMSEELQRRYDYLTAQYRQDKDRWQQGMLRAKAMDEDKAQRDRRQGNWKLQFGLQKAANDRAAANDARAAKAQDLALKAQQSELDYLPTKRKMAEEKHLQDIAYRKAAANNMRANTAATRQSASDRHAVATMQRSLSGVGKSYKIQEPNGQVWQIPRDYWDTDGVIQIYTGLGLPIGYKDVMGEEHVYSKHEMQAKLHELISGGQLTDRQRAYLQQIAISTTGEAPKGVTLGLQGGVNKTAGKSLGGY